MARLFNGSSDYIAANAAAGYSQQAAFSAGGWVKATRDSTVRRAYAEASSSNHNPFFFIETNSSADAKALIICRNNGGGVSQLQVTTTADVFDGDWHHVLYTQDAAGGDAAGHYAVYVDGVADILGSFNTGATSVDLLDLGALDSPTAGGLQGFFNGSLAHWAKWGRKLAAGEAASLGHGAPPSLFAPSHYWPLFGRDSPEPDLGTATTKVPGTLTGTSQAAGGPPSALSMLTLQGLLAGKPGKSVATIGGSTARYRMLTSMAGPLTPLGV